MGNKGLLIKYQIRMSTQPSAQSPLDIKIFQSCPTLFVLSMFLKIFFSGLHVLNLFSTLIKSFKFS